MLRFMHSLSIALCLGLCILGLATNTAQAQQKIFNVPSPDVMDPGRVSLSAVHNLRLWHTPSRTAELLDIQGVYGIGHDMELGANIGSLDYRHKSAPFMDATLKWRPWHTAIGTGNDTSTVGLVVGDNLGIGMRGNVSGHVRNLVYAAPYLDFSVTSTRISAGVYHATRDVFNSHARAGAQVTFEQAIPVVPHVVLAADWYSGNGGSFTPGLLWVKNNFSARAGYSLSNNGRKNDLIILITTLTF